MPFLPLVTHILPELKSALNLSRPEMPMPFKCGLPACSFFSFLPFLLFSVRLHIFFFRWGGRKRCGAKFWWQRTEETTVQGIRILYFFGVLFFFRLSEWGEGESGFNQVFHTMNPVLFVFESRGPGRHRTAPSPSWR